MKKTVILIVLFILTSTSIALAVPMPGPTEPFYFFTEIMLKILKGPIGFAVAGGLAFWGFTGILHYNLAPPESEYHGIDFHEYLHHWIGLIGSGIILSADSIVISLGAVI